MTDERARMTVRSLAPRSVAELPDDALVSVEEVARAFGCSPRTVWRAGIPFVAIGPRTRRFRIADVRRWIAEHVRGAA